MFSIGCRICGLQMADLYLHVAWHIDQGHEMTEEEATRLRGLANEAEKLTREAAKNQ